MASRIQKRINIKVWLQDTECFHFVFKIDKLPSESAYQALDDLYTPQRPTMEELQAGKIVKKIVSASSIFLNTGQILESYVVTVVPWW